MVTFAAGSGPNDVETSNTLVTLNDDIYVEENIETANILGTVQGSVGTFNINTATLQIVDNDGKQKSVGKYIYRGGVGWGGVGGVRFMSPQRCSSVSVAYGMLLVRT